MNPHSIRSLGTVIAVAVALAVGTAAAAEPKTSKKAEATIEQFKKADPSLTKAIHEAAGYAVIPRVRKGAFVFGGAGGKGALYEKGVLTGTISMTQVTVGLQAGGQEYAELLLFKDDDTLANFKLGRVKLAAQTSAVAASAGVAANARYEKGVQVFTLPLGGLMFEASVGGQTFSYSPLETAKPVSML